MASSASINKMTQGLIDDFKKPESDDNNDIIERIDELESKLSDMIEEKLNNLSARAESEESGTETEEPNDNNIEEERNNENDNN